MKQFPIPSQPPRDDRDKPSRDDNDADDAPSYAKGGTVVSAHYAFGGPVLGRTRDFMKEPSPQRSDVRGVPPANQRPVGAGGTTIEEKAAYPKSGKGEKGKDKSMKPVMPGK